MASTIEIFFCYSREDEQLRQGLEKQLRALKRQGIINVWHDRNISAGEEWEKEIDKHLNTAHIILLLVSPDFMGSDYCYGIEMQRAMERHETGEACVIPIILRPVYWQKAPFGKLQALPTDAKPVTSHVWHSLDDAFFDVAEGIRKVIEEFFLTKEEIMSLLEPHQLEIQQLKRESIQHAIIYLITTDRQWWQVQGKAAINNLRNLIDNDHKTDLVVALATVAIKVVGKVRKAIQANDISLTLFWTDVLDVFTPAHHELSAAPDIQKKLVHLLALALVDSVSSELEPEQFMDHLGNVLMGLGTGATESDLLLLEQSAAKVGESYGHECPPVKLMPYVKVVLGEACYLPSSQKEDFIDRCLSLLLKDFDTKTGDSLTNNSTFWPDEVLAEWNAYLKRHVSTHTQAAYSRFQEALRHGDISSIIAAYDSVIDSCLTPDEHTMLTLARQFIEAYNANDDAAIVAAYHAIRGSQYQAHLKFTQTQLTRINSVQPRQQDQEQEQLQVRPNARVGLKLTAAAKTDVGKQAEQNEDMPYKRIESSKEGDRGLFIVADGWGPQDGDVASKLAVERISEALHNLVVLVSNQPSIRSSPSSVPDDDATIKTPYLETEKFSVIDDDATIKMPHLETEKSSSKQVKSRKLPETSVTKNIEEELKAAFQQANKAILRYSERKISARGLGCIVTAVLIQNDQAYIVNIGDSRTYLLRNGELKALTKDHSLVARLVEAKQIEPEDVYSHPQRNLIYRSLGAGHKSVNPDVFHEILRDGDILLLCSDGLWEMVRHDDLRRILSENANPQKICDTLIDLANANGGEDNITAVVVYVSAW